MEPLTVPCETSSGVRTSTKSAPFLLLYISIALSQEMVLYAGASAKLNPEKNRTKRHNKSFFILSPEKV